MSSTFETCSLLRTSMSTDQSVKTGKIFNMQGENANIFRSLFYKYIGGYAYVVVMTNAP